jgi:hypothetical protein
MASEKTTVGFKIAASILPFMTSRHTCSKSECIDMVSKPIDRIVDSFLGELRLMESLLVGLQTSGINVKERLANVRRIIKDYSPK